MERAKQAHRDTWCTHENASEADYIHQIGLGYLQVGPLANSDVEETNKSRELEIVINADNGWGVILQEAVHEVQW